MENRRANEMTLKRLDKWFSDQCDGDWEHSHGIVIHSLDNPGWDLSIYILGTEIEDIEIKDFKEGDDFEKDWIEYRIKDGKFIGSCGLGRLDELLNIFLRYAGY